MLMTKSMFNILEMEGMEWDKVSGTGQRETTKD